LPAGALIGEPTGLVPVRGHKGKAAYRLTVEGKPGHSSRPDLGKNAIHGLSSVLSRITEVEESLRHGPLKDGFEPPYSTMQTGLIKGGQALNIIAGEASLSVEARAVPGVDPLQLLAPVLERARSLANQGYEVHCEQLANYPALNTEAGHAFLTHVE